MTEQVLAEQRIGQNTEVTLHFALRLENGDTVDSTFDKAPATFKVGDGNLLPGFEVALFGFKAGDNKTNHSHLDLGSFVLESDGVRWAVDLGSDDYDLPGYFGDKRWSYFRLTNRSHNTATPGDLLQDTQATAPIVKFSGLGPRPFAVADLTAAYPGVAQRIERGVSMIRGARVLIQDDYTALRP